MTATNITTHRKLIRISGTILINKDVEGVFNFYANPSNDHLWRTEINKSTLDGELQLGVTAAEYSYLSKKAPNNLLEMKCTQFNKNKIAIFETLQSEKFYLKSERITNSLPDLTTEITYKLEFDKNIVKFATGISLPIFLISWKAKDDLRKYLQQLKKYIEKD
ncbi:MAG: hypothetical protein REI64_00045 [Pedobacter sp.]|uniref:hypothetical protein n=1 Tax=Pedobacter sp. TaxID=1411316 RepID=UPI002808E767|nr:hypothetical protein [Pedobacter sp.]MDQ8003150.1 hypothetical protein [Pedobacter sp.]